MLFPNNLEINRLHASKDATFRSYRAMRIRSFSNLTFHSLFCLLVTLPPPIFCASLGFFFSPIRIHPILPSRPVLLFYATTFAVIYTVCIYFTARRKTSRPLYASLFPRRTGDYHPLWARTLSRPLSRSWPVPAGYKPSRDNHRDTKCVSARKSCVRTPRWHLGIVRFTVFM